MNGPIAFSRTLRAFDADDFRISNLLLLLVFVLLAAWTWWFFRSTVPQFETTHEVRIQPNLFVASFPARALEHLRPGQSAVLDVDGIAIPAKVSAIASDAAGGEIRVLLMPATERQPPASGSHRVEASVEVERVTPAALVMRAIGRPTNQ
jgi:hypothetical protein